MQHWVETRRTRPPTPTRWWYVTLAFGIATLLFGFHLEQVFPPTGHAIAPGYGVPVLAFEFARGQEDLVAIFGPDSDPAQVVRLAAMRTGNERDYLYMLFYAGFLASGCIALFCDLRLRPLLAAAVVPVFAALCDAYENALLFDIQAAYTLGDYSPAMASLPGPVSAKFLALAATNVAIGLALTRIGRWWGLFGTLVILAAIPTIMALIAPAAFGWALVPSTGAGWIVLLAVAATGSWAALVQKRPLVDYAAPVLRRRVADEAPLVRAPRPLFGRRKPGR
ncbi:hypothetical protein [Sphingopyxis sp.]|uniref:hypothetical protein n=1 Tax=Sphingopyxis sp. TaxID=1908224 RepID=UPI003D80FBBE